MSTTRAYNFNAGPSALPLTVLQKAQAELVNYNGTGMSVMEMSHRSKEYEEIHNRAIELLRELLAIPSDYDVLFLQGGASLQFYMAPLNYLTPGKKAGYILSGSWSEKALEEAEKTGETYEVASGKSVYYKRIPSSGEFNIAKNTAYIHLTSNNTIYGTQWAEFPDIGNIPLFADMSSDILSRPCDISKFSLIYAGAQKNLGPSGVTVVILKKDMHEKANKELPTMLRYDIHANKNSLYNTPPAFGIYMLGLVLAWTKEMGGAAVIEKTNQKKAGLIYDAIDQSGGFYRGHAEKDSRSLMNITFRLPSEELEKKFLAEARKENFVGLGGHRSVGGCRASLYNAVSIESCQALAAFMKHFQEANA